MGDEVAMVVAAPAPVDETMEEAVTIENVKVASAGHEGNGNGNGNVVALVDGNEQPPVEDVNAPTSEEEKLWSAVKENDADFNAWTLLINETEKLENIARIEKAYDAFLAEFPLCYGYWKKYADDEAKMGTPEKIVDVYERAVKAVTYSVDIWMHYCAYAMEKFDNPEKIRSLFERGVSFVGTDYLSHLLWDKYIEFEYSQQEWSRLAQIYTRILQIPLQQLDRYHNSFKQIANSRPLAELRTPEETAAAVEAKAAAESIEEVPAADAEEATPAGETDGAAKPEKTPEAIDAEELEKFLAVREAFYKAAKDGDAKIRDFEIAIRRPYFHVKPLDDAQLGNWHRYLDFIEKEGVTDKIVKLYERCLIACANYPEYWIRYVQHMDTEGNTELALNALHRATAIFVKRRPEIQLFGARYKEQQGDVKGARVAYELLRNELAPGLLEAIVKQANFEQRQGNLEAACSVFDAALHSEKTKEEPRALTILYIQYARFLDQVVNSTDKAREVYTTALDHLPTSKVLWEAAIHFEASCTPEKRQVHRVDALVEQASAPSRPDGSPGLSAADREEISSVYLEFVDLFGDVEAIKKAEARHRQLFPLRKGGVESKKRPSLDSAGPDRVKVHKPFVVATATPPPAGPPVYNNGQAQWNSAGYAPQAGYAQQQPQGWQQPPPQQPAPQVQPQQWNQGYGAHQGAYAGYGGYTAYGPPQQQAPIPQQQPAYGGYGQGYPPQEVVQPYPQVQAPAGYVQEAAYRAPVPSPTAPQPQPAAAAYYGNYY